MDHSCRQLTIREVAEKIELIKREMAELQRMLKRLQTAVERSENKKKREQK